MAQTDPIVDLIEDTKKNWQRLSNLDLLDNIAELAIKGYTVIPPEKVNAGALIAEAREAILALADAQQAANKNYETYEQGLSYELYHLVKQGAIFEKLLVNPAVLAIGYYLLGENMLLNNSLAYVKGRTPKYLRMHSDTLMVPDPLPEYLHLVNFTFALTPYSLEGGCIGIAPGSHRYRRHPTSAEAVNYEVMSPIPCPAGSVIVIPGNTWHGAFPKITDPLRVTLVQAYSRRYFTPSVNHEIDDSVIQRNPPEFARLLGREEWTRYDTKGLDIDKFMPSYRSQRSHLS